jgi:large subunit ribosomal protein L4
MNVPTYTKSGNKASTSAKLPKSVFAVESISHELLRQAYNSYLANGRTNNARTKTRGEVRGGGKKPWKQKGTGRARFGSIRVPIWRGGGITFGPTGNENYSMRLPINMKRAALRQALTLAANDNKIIVIETFENRDNKTAETSALLNKVQARRNVLLVLAQVNEEIERATRNIQNLTVRNARAISVFEIMNADTVVLTNETITAISNWLSSKSGKSINSTTNGDEREA